MTMLLGVRVVPVRLWRSMVGGWIPFESHSIYQLMMMKMMLINGD